MENAESPEAALKTAIDRAQAARRSGDAQAETYLSEVRALARPRADDLFLLAQVMQDFGDVDGLQEVRRRLAQMDESRPRVALSLGRVLRMLGDDAAAVVHLRHAAKRRAGIADAHIALTLALLDLGEVAGAAAAGRAGLDRHPENVALWQNTLRAEAALDVARLDLAELDALIAAAPSRAGSHRLRLSVLRRLRLFEAAHSAVDAFAAACPRACDPVLEHAALDMMEDDPKAARARLSEAMTEAPPNLDRLAKLGQILGADGDLDGVAQVLERLQSVPSTAKRQEITGRLRLLTGDHEAALADLTGSLQDAPEHPRVWAQCMETMTQLGRGADALTLFQGAPDPIRQRPDLRIKASNAAWAVGQVEAAITYLDTPELVADPAILRHLTDRLVSLGRVAEARQKLQDWTPRQSAEQASRLIGLAIAARAEYDFLTVERLVLEALDLDPSRVSAWWHLAQTRLILCNPDGAMAAWKRMIGLNRAAGVRVMKHQGTLLWHKAEEMQLDAATTRTLATAWEDGPEALAQVAARALTSGIDQIGPALSLMIAMRRIGDFDGVATREKSMGGASPIPKVIYQYWEGHLPPDLAGALDQMKRMNPDCRYSCFDRAEAWDWLKENATPSALRAFELGRHPAERADIFRLALLVREGGIYIDADDFCIAPIHKFIPKNSHVVVFQEFHGAIANNFIATVPGNPVLQHALDSAIEETLANAATSIWLRTGPGLITRMTAAAFAERGINPLPNWHVLRQVDMIDGLVICAPFSYKLDHRHWMKMDLGR